MALIVNGRGDEVVQETRLWEEAAQRTVSMRRKEGLADYRYYLEPDLQPIVVTPHVLDEALRDMPELPAQARERYAALGLPLKARRVRAAHAPGSAYCLTSRWCRTCCCWRTRRTWLATTTACLPQARTHVRLQTG